MSRNSSVRVGMLQVNKEKLLGKGAYCAVYEGIYEDKTPVAVKILQDSFADIETEILKESKHKNIVRYYCTESNDFLCFVATELCRGTLEDYIQGKFPDLRLDDKNILEEIARGLEYLHSKGVVHRDIKPLNILISKDPEPVMKITDFGISKKGQGDYTMTSQGWTPPELYGNNGRFSTSADIFSLGCLFSYVLTKGKHPFGEPLDRPTNIYKRVIPFNLPEIETSANLIKRMLNHDLFQRPTIKDVLSDPFFVPIDSTYPSHSIPDLSKSNLIGEGSFDTAVYEYKFEGRLVAVKRVRQSLSQVACELDILKNPHSAHCPYIIKYFKYEKDLTYWYLFMELCLGNVTQHLKDLPARIFSKKVVEGLNYLHSMNVIHRDLKPENVLVTADAKGDLIPKLADFGISKYDSGGENITHECRGSLGWKAPELFQNPAKFGFSVDVFAAGCVVYYIETKGNHPFQQTSIDTLDLDLCHSNIRTGKWPKWKNQPADRSALINLVGGMIEKEPEKRPGSSQILEHPFFWNEEQSLNFIRRVVDENISREDFSNALESISNNVFAGDWTSKLSPGVLENIKIGQGGKERRVKFSGESIQDLLTCIRHKSTHYESLPQKVKDEYGEHPSGYWTYWNRRFPKLLVEEMKTLVAAEVADRLASASKDGMDMFWIKNEQTIIQIPSERPFLAFTLLEKHLEICDNSDGVAIARPKEEVISKLIQNTSIHRYRRDNFRAMATPKPTRAGATVAPHTPRLRHHQVAICSWNPNDPGRFASVSNDGTAILWIYGKNPVGLHSRDPLLSVAWSASGEFLAIGDVVGLVTIYDKTGEKVLSLKKIKGFIQQLQFHPTRSELLAVTPNKVCVWNTKLGWKPMRKYGHLKPIAWGSLDCGGGRLAICGEKEIHILDYTSFQCHVIVENAHQDVINQVKWGPVVDTLATCSNDKTVKVWCGPQCLLKHELRIHQNSVTAIEWITENLVISSSNGKFVLWYLLDNSIRFVCCGTHGDIVSSLGFSGSSLLLALGCDEHIKVVQLLLTETDKTDEIGNTEINKIVILTQSFTSLEQVNQVCWNEDGTRFATVSDTGNIEIYLRPPFEASENSTPIPRHSAETEKPDNCREELDSTDYQRIISELTEILAANLSKNPAAKRRRFATCSLL